MRVAVGTATAATAAPSPTAATATAATAAAAGGAKAAYLVRGTGGEEEQLACARFSRETEICPRCGRGTAER